MSTRWKSVIICSFVLVLVCGFSPVLGQERVNMEFKQAPLVDVFQILGQLGGYNVLVDPSVSGEASFTLNDLQVEEALDLVTRTTGYRYKLLGKTLVIASENRLKSEFGTEDFSFVSIKNVDVQSAKNLVAMIVPSVRTYVDQELDLIVLFGLTTDLSLAEQVIKQYDRQGVSLAPVVTTPVLTNDSEEDGLNRFLVSVNYADGNRVLELMKRQFPEREFSWDENLRQLTGITTDEEWEMVTTLVTDNDYPDFKVKGILSNKDSTVVLVEHENVTRSLKLGDSLLGWQLTAINDGVMEFSQDDLKFTSWIGR